MINASIDSIRPMSLATLSLLAWQLGEFTADANPTGGTVAQGAATFSTSGSTFTINQTSANALINWSTFNIANGETTTFVQPSSTSLVWNQINDSSPSQILGNLNANGYVILQNQNGFYVGGNAAISAHGLVLTTSPTPAPTLSGGGAWEFDTPPVGSDIINYGKINITGGGFAYLIADGIQNYGTIEAEQGKIGLYDGEKVLLSPNADGHGISARVTLPAGSVDNEGKLIADGGAIAALAQTVNQNGLVQANAVQNVNGVIELVASGNLNLGTVPNAANPNPTPDIEANGDAASANPSPGGFVVLQAGGSFSDTSSSKINVSGQNGGQNGVIEVFGNNLTGATSLNSQIGNNFALLVNPYDLTVSGNSTGTSTDANNNLDANFNVSDLAAYSQIDLHALDNIELSTSWTLKDPSVNNPGARGALSLTAGNSIILDDNTGISAGNNWEVNLAAGTGFVPTAAQPTPTPGANEGPYNYGVYVNNDASVQTQNGDINVWAANEVLISADPNYALYDGIRTLAGGSIDVTAQFGDVNTGANAQGYVYNRTAAPYYTVTTSLPLGGISTAAGGNVDITAGGDVYSYLPNGANAANDAGTGAFGPEAGNVNITAGGSVYGHYVLANGTGIITAQNGDVGTRAGVTEFALSLIAGSWTVNAPNGSIYLQEVRNPNGVFNNQGNKSDPAGQHLFNYAPDASVTLDAGGGVDLTDANLPRLTGFNDVPVLYPPILNITAGSGGVTLDGDVTLFPSADQNLSITTTDGGALVAPTSGIGTPTELLMSDSSQERWVAGAGTFSDTDHGSFSAEPTDPTPVTLNIAGDMEDLILITTKETQINVGGNMINCGFSGQNLSASDTTSIKVQGQIYNQSAYTYVDGVSIPGVPATDLPGGINNAWDTVFFLAVNPAELANLVLPAGTPTSQWLVDALQGASLFGTHINDLGQWVDSGDQGFTYNAATGRLWYGGPMSQGLLSELTGPITILRLENGQPVLGSNGQFETDTINWISPSVLETLATDSQIDPNPQVGQLGYRLGGPGNFNVSAASISLGNTYGILSCGAYDTTGGFDRYNNLASITTSGAAVNVTVTADQAATEVVDGTTIQPHASLDMLTSTIATLGGGDVNVTSLDGSMDLGTEELFNTERQVGFGVFTAGEGNVTVQAGGDIDIDGSRIATYNGGNITVESTGGNVDAGSGGDTPTGVYLTYVDNGTAMDYAEDVYGSGIVANTLVPGTANEGYPPSGSSVTVAKAPGNITVKTPQGNITASLGGITQESLGTATPVGPTITLAAGTPGGHTGNIDLGESGVIGGTVNATANGNISGLIISRQNSTVQAVGTFSGSVLAGGSATVSGTTVSGVIVGVGGVSVSGTVTAEVLGQNVSVNGGASQSTLGSSASATSTSGSAAQQANANAQQEVASSNTDDDDKKKKKTQALLQRVKRVTVILSQKS
jgi:filamentous hemagglutinin family protein